MAGDALYAYCARLLAGGVGDSSVEAAALAECAQDQGVTGLLLDLPAFAAPGLAPQRAALQAMARTAVMHEMAGCLEARRVLSVLAGAGIDVLLLKGSALAYWLYREPWHRPRADLDVLVANVDAARLAVAALASAGYSLVAGVGPDATDGFEVALQRQAGIVVDLHWQLLNHAVLTRGLPFGGLARHARAIPALHPHAQGLGHVHALLHALLHRVTNIAKGEADRLIWLYDIHLLAAHLDEDDWNEVVDASARHAIATPCLEGLRATRAILRTALPPAIDAALSAQVANEQWQLDASNQGAMDRAHLRALPLPGQVAWLRNKLLPSREFMRHRYAAEGMPGLMGAYLRRWWLGIRRLLGARS